MKIHCLMIIILIVLASCTSVPKQAYRERATLPVLRQDLMDNACHTIQFSDIRENPDLYRGKLYILGGIIVHTTTPKEGSLIEAVYVPVDPRGYLKGDRVSNERFLTVFHGKEPLDSLIFHEGREGKEKMQ